MQHYTSSRIVSLTGRGAYIHHNTINVTKVMHKENVAQAIEIVDSPTCVVEDNKIVNTITAAQRLLAGVIIWRSNNCAVRFNAFLNPKNSPLDVGIWLVQSNGVDTTSNEFSNVTTEVLIQ